MMKNKKNVFLWIFLLLIPSLPNSFSQEMAVGPVWAFPKKPVAGKSLGISHKSRDIREGIAAWYSKSDPYICRYTANGDVFDDSKRTCAIWGIPFGTRLKVTNLENKKSVVCRVNDRGPARYLGRQVDLTKAAFRKIASLRQGVVRVSIVPVKSNVN